MFDERHIIQHQQLPDINPFSLSDLPTLDEVWEAGKGDIARARSEPDHLEISDHDLREFMTRCLTEIKAIELAARNPDRWHISPEEAKRTRLIIDFSAPGTYRDSEKEDRYKGLPWAKLMDRERADAAALLGIYKAGLITGVDFSEFTTFRILDDINPLLTKRRAEVHRSLRESGIHFVYLGRPDEGAAIRRVIHTRGSFIPPELVTVIDDPKIQYTIDQVPALKQFLASTMQSESNPSGFLTPGSSIDFVMGAQAIRAFRFCGRFDAIPAGLHVNLFPLGTHVNGLKEYPTNEVKGTAAYLIRGKANNDPIPFNLLGKVEGN